MLDKVLHNANILCYLKNIKHESHIITWFGLALNPFDTQNNGIVSYILVFSYGDCCPRTFYGKCFGLIWMLTGYVIITMFLGTITTVLTSISLEGKGDILGVKVTLGVG